MKRPGGSDQGADTDGWSPGEPGSAFGWHKKVSGPGTKVRTTPKPSPEPPPRPLTKGELHRKNIADNDIYNDFAVSNYESGASAARSTGAGDHPPSAARAGAASDLCSLGERLRRCRAASGLSQAALARATGISKNRVGHIEQSASSPTPEEVAQLCWATGCSDQTSELADLAIQRLVPAGLGTGVKGST